MYVHARNINVSTAIDVDDPEEDANHWEKGDRSGARFELCTVYGHIHQQIQPTLRGWATVHTMVFAGCMQGYSDPAQSPLNPRPRGHCCCVKTTILIIASIPFLLKSCTQREPKFQLTVWIFFHPLSDTYYFSYLHYCQLRIGTDQTATDKKTKTPCVLLKPSVSIEKVQSPPYLSKVP